MNARRMASLIGRRGYLRVGPLRVPVVVRDVRQRFGRVDVRVAPVGGKGRAWRELGAAVSLLPQVEEVGPPTTT